MKPKRVILKRDLRNRPPRQGSKYHARRRQEVVAAARTLKEAEKAKEAFQRWCCSQGFHSAAEILDHDWERMVSFYRYPKEHWVHLRTTNPIESPFAAVRL